jgi:predicted N-formylglutamate amidohydrolase
MTQWESVAIARGGLETSLLILCDHATNLLPPSYGTLGLASSELNRHIAYDIGALPVALDLGARLNATVISSRFSRLLIDPNRGEDDPTLIMQLSDGAVVPGNARIEAPERARRISDFYLPYHAAIEAEIGAMLGRGLVPAILSVHSFTEAWRGVLRPWHAGILWDKDPRLAVPLIETLRTRTGRSIGDNEPYSGCLRNDVLYRHATRLGLPNALIEIRQDLIREAEGRREWAALLAECLSAILGDPETAPQLARIDYYGSHTDIEGKAP